MVTYRTDDATRWGVGKGSNLSAVQVDRNFWELSTRIIQLEENPSAGNSIQGFTVTGSQMTIHMENGTAFGPFTLPRAMIHYRGDWLPDFLYNEMDLVAVPGDGLYLVLLDHESAEAFSETAGHPDTGQPLYRKLIPLSEATSVGEAPLDDILYGRLNGNWSPIGSTISWSNITSKPSTFPPSAHFHSFISLNDTPAGYGNEGQLLAVNPTRTGFVWIDKAVGGGGGLGGGVIATIVPVPFINYDFEAVTDLDGWIVEVGSVTAGASSGTGYTGDPFPQQEGTKFLKHDVADGASFEVSQTHILDFSNGGFLVVGLKVLQTFSLHDLPFVRLTYYDAEDVEIFSEYKHAPPNMLDLWMWQSVSFVVPEGTVKVKFGFGGEWNSGAVTNVGIDAVSAVGCAFRLPEIDTGLEDAPFDDAYYVRHNNSWSLIPEVTWEAVLDKPAMFLPTPHMHPWGEVTEKPTEFPPIPHGHSVGDITGLSFIMLPDTPSEYTGHAGKVVKVNSEGTGLVYEAPAGTQQIIPYSGNRTLELTDAGNYLRSTGETASTLTIPINASVPFPIGTLIHHRTAGDGKVTFAGAGVSINPPFGQTLVTPGAGATVAMLKVATDAWDIIGHTEAIA